MLPFVVPAVLVVAGLIVACVGALREHRRAAQTGGLRGTVPFAVRLWAWQQVAGLVVGLVGLALLAGFFFMIGAQSGFKPTPTCASVLREHPELAKPAKGVEEIGRQNQRDAKINCIDDGNWSTTLDSYKLARRLKDRWSN